MREDDPSLGNNSAPDPSPPWWQGPRPDYWPANQPWPPPLPAGATYGAQPGSINYPGNAPPFVPGQPVPSYYLPGVTPTTSTSPPPSSTAGSGSSAGGGNPNIGPFNEPFNAPATVNLGGPQGLPFIPQTPTFTPPTFHIPTAEEAANDPGYQFSLGEGSRALQQSAAARGVLNTGGTLKDLINYGQAAGATQYGNVFNRNLQAQGANLQSAQAAFAPIQTAYNTQAAAGQRLNETNWQQAFDKWLQDYNIRQGNNANAIQLTTAQ